MARTAPAPAAAAPPWPADGWPADAPGAKQSSPWHGAIRMDDLGEKPHDVLPAPARCGLRQSLASSATAIRNS
jgi:hypothetical protein